MVPISGNFTDSIRYPCASCKDGYFIEHLTTVKGWKYVKLPIDGLKSLVFQGPSPLWCMAAGNVWFDFPDVSKVRCFTHRTVDGLRWNYEKLPEKLFDWDYFSTTGNKCIRLTKYGFFHRPT